MYFLGLINVASGGFANNHTGASGGTVFTIPKTIRSLFIEPNVATGQFQFSVATGISFRASPTNAAYWGAGAEFLAAGPFQLLRTDTDHTVAVYSGAGACVVKVFAGT